MPSRFRRLILRQILFLALLLELVTASHVVQPNARGFGLVPHRTHSVRLNKHQALISRYKLLIDPRCIRSEACLSPSHSVL